MGDRILCLFPLLLIHGYRCTLSRLMGGWCRFYPTCSAYGVDAFERRPFAKALALTLWRVLRCNPLGRGGYDPLDEDEPGEKKGNAN